MSPPTESTVVGEKPLPQADRDRARDYLRAVATISSYAATAPLAELLATLHVLRCDLPRTLGHSEASR